MDKASQTFNSTIRAVPSAPKKTRINKHDIAKRDVKSKIELINSLRALGLEQNEIKDAIALQFY